MPIPKLPECLKRPKPPFQTGSGKSDRAAQRRDTPCHDCQTALLCESVNGACPRRPGSCFGRHSRTGTGGGPGGHQPAGPEGRYAGIAASGATIRCPGPRPAELPGYSNGCCGQTRPVLKTFVLRYRLLPRDHPTGRLAETLSPWKLPKPVPSVPTPANPKAGWGQPGALLRPVLARALALAGESTWLDPDIVVLGWAGSCRAITAVRAN